MMNKLIHLLGSLLICFEETEAREFQYNFQDSPSPEASVVVVSQTVFDCDIGGTIDLGGMARKV